MSATPNLPVAPSAIREAARRAVAASSIRIVASAVDISPTGLVKFIGGAKPRASTMRKLLAWYVRQSGEVDSDAALAAIAFLVNTYPPSHRAEVRERLLEVLREGHWKAGAEPPEWLK